MKTAARKPTRAAAGPRPTRSADKRARPGPSGGSAHVERRPGPDNGPLLRVTPQLIEAALGVVLRLDGPADLKLRSFFREHPQLGRRDRGVVAETVFDVLRHRRRYAHLAQGLGGSPVRALMRLSIVSRLGPGSAPALGLDDGLLPVLQRLLAMDTALLPQAVRLSLPDWLHESLLREAHAGARLSDVASSDVASSDVTDGDAAAVPQHSMAAVERIERLGQALLQPAPLDLRVNLLKSDLPSVLAALQAAQIEAVALPDLPAGLRLQGKPAIEKLPAFEQGWFEVQDAGSQRLVEFAAVRRGQTVVDFCAGAGGKTLALAAAMRSTGQIYACDVSASRLQRMRARLMRSGATNVQPFGLDSEHDPKLRRLKGRADLVLVDAPCSGTGTLRRNPELKWRMNPADIEALHARQVSILTAASLLVKPGGALVYATCSLLERENEAVAETFDAPAAGFSEPQCLRLRPDQDDTDGFFALRWVRTIRPAGPATA